MYIKIYTDGAYSSKTNIGGWALISVPEAVSYDNELYKYYYKDSGWEHNTTNNRMELLAVIVGLEAIKRPNAQVNVYSDSSYVVKAINEGWIQGWLKKGLHKQKNADLWERFLVIYRKHQVRFFWIKGHAGHPENERCDALAVEAALSPELKIDAGYEAAPGQLL